MSLKSKVWLNYWVTMSPIELSWTAKKVDHIVKQSHLLPRFSKNNVSTVHDCSSLSFRLYWTVCWSVWPASSVQNLLWINWKLWLWWKLLLLFWFWDWCYWSDLVTTLFDIRYPCSNNWQRLALRPEQDLKMIKIIDIIRISSLLKRKKQEDLEDDCYIW